VRTKYVNAMYFIDYCAQNRYTVAMSATARFHCITTSDARIETFADGEVEFSPTATYLTMQMPDYTMRIGVSDDVTTVTRIGADAYTIVLREGEQTLMDLGFACHTLYTHKIRFKRAAGKIDLSVKYSYDGDDDLTVSMIVHAAFEE
jgi:hypothetical protein